MSRKFRADIPSLEPNAPEVFFGRRKFLTAMAMGILGVPRVFSSVYANEDKGNPLSEPLKRPDVFPASRTTKYQLPSGLKRDLTPRKVAARYNNFYEFLPGHGGPVWKYVDNFEVVPWRIEITGECNNPMTIDLDDLFKFEHEDRVYHFRCVERWAMNIPWSGFSLSKLIKKADPKSSAKFVRFLSANRPDQMPGLKSSPSYPWPYHESLRMDEAMNELTMVVTGVYGKPLLKQHGAPVRIVVPWKYGYKSPKSIVRIEFLSNQPDNFWQIQPHEYGFLSNVNPNIPHPRWSQEQSFWLGSGEWFPTPIFNGYERYVAHLYPDEPRAPQKSLRPGQIAR
ncbi:MAG: protein-methionine-sulfoxide reductase catalytic subunit MsrP [Proteobacteria bacterium]|nr:protein-methionine-sulfoxide reductase catalytic subunit MsrP [Pseudomonadota bacterium]